eukprot:5484316-Lingulodinium_polyedra.AAC.1
MLGHLREAHPARAPNITRADRVWRPKTAFQEHARRQHALGMPGSSAGPPCVLGPPPSTTTAKHL